MNLNIRLVVTMGRQLNNRDLGGEQFKRLCSDIASMACYAGGACECIRGKFRDWYVSSASFLVPLPENRLVFSLVYLKVQD